MGEVATVYDTEKKHLLPWAAFSGYNLSERKALRSLVQVIKAILLSVIQDKNVFITSPSLSREAKGGRSFIVYIKHKANLETVGKPNEYYSSRSLLNKFPVSKIILECIQLNTPNTVTYLPSIQRVPQRGRREGTNVFMDVILRHHINFYVIHLFITNLNWIKVPS